MTELVELLDVWYAEDQGSIRFGPLCVFESDFISDYRTVRWIAGAEGKQTGVLAYQDSTRSICDFEREGNFGEPTDVLDVSQCFTEVAAVQDHVEACQSAESD